jgi:hypothetical protein
MALFDFVWVTIAVAAGIIAWRFAKGFLLQKRPSQDHR